ncbi:MAG: hypothetical protein IPP40_06265 [bacterium]|nr:hypothetical protein [bacterium]
MDLIENGSLLSVIENCRTRHYSGSVALELGDSALTVWFVRGNLAHAECSNGDIGWKALEVTKSVLVTAVKKCEGELPPERTIRVDTSRLLKAMNATQGVSTQRAMHVPVPLHSRLQQKFSELKHRISGLKNFETMQSSATSESGAKVANGVERTILEKDPRGSKWTHLSDEKQLVLRGDETITTTELMWAGAELWKELDSANRRAIENE